MINSRLMKYHKYLLVPIIHWWVHPHVIDTVCTDTHTLNFLQLRSLPSLQLQILLITSYLTMLTFDLPLFVCPFILFVFISLSLLPFFSHGQLWSSDHYQNIVFSLCFKFFNMILAVIYQLHTMKTFPWINIWVAMSSFYVESSIHFLTRKI